MAALPDFLERKTHVELYRRDVESYFRRAILLVFLGVSAAGLANVFGQHTRVMSVDAPKAKLTVEAPHAARGGLIYQVRFRVDAHSALDKPALVLGPGWFDGLTINTIEPDLVEWSEENGRVVAELPAIQAGHHLVVRFQYQVNPTVIGHRSQAVVLEDGGTPITTVDHDQIIFP
jgi:hypothetical protein